MLSGFFVRIYAYRQTGPASEAKHVTKMIGASDKSFALFSCQDPASAFSNELPSIRLMDYSLLFGYATLQKRKCPVYRGDSVKIKFPLSNGSMRLI